MLRNTFCHMPGIGLQTERHLWACGVQVWEDFPTAPSERLSFGKQRITSMHRYIDQSLEHLQRGDPDYFADLLPASQQWRLFADFRPGVAYLDIETTGMGNAYDYITTIALYDGKRILHYVRGDNLNQFREDIQRYKVLVTYNGKCFDIPFIRHHLGMHLDQVHIDLRYVLKSLGYSGGLKGCERQLGIDRGELDGLDGYFAVLLWNDFKKNGNAKALETLLAYNIEDVLNLETLMVAAYNFKLKETPFSHSHMLPEPSAPASPFRGDPGTIEKIKRTVHWYG